MIRTVHSTLAAQVTGDLVTVELQVAVAERGEGREELGVTLDGLPVPVTEHATEAGGRLHVLQVSRGALEVSYRCEVLGRADPARTRPLDASTYLRPSRYAESDRLAAIAATELAGLVSTAELVRGTAAWVGRRLAYVPGSSSGTDGAVDTLLAGAGVCRDYAHLVVALLRARDVPARLVSVYAPGLDPMDFHAVVEALVEGQWQVVDATLLAPRASLVRVATGRDAADTAFLSSYGGGLQLDRVEVGAVVEGDLPSDDLDDRVLLG